MTRSVDGSATEHPFSRLRADLFDQHSDENDETWPMAHELAIVSSEAMLRELHANAPGEKAKAEYAKALDEIATEKIARKLDKAREAYQARHGRDIERVEDLVAGPDPILRKLPRELHDWEWILHEHTGEIVSSYYKARYQVHQKYRPGQFTPSAASKKTSEREQKGS